MFNPSFNVDRASIIALAMMAALPFLALSPANAATADCAAEAQAIKVQALVDGMSPSSATKALRTVRIGEKICAEGGRHEAAKKFAAARARLNQDVQYADRR